MSGSHAATRRRSEPRQVFFGYIGVGRAAIGSGMLALPGRMIGDCWFRVHDGRCHGYLLTAPAGVARHCYWEITHAVSENLTDWEVLGEVVRPVPDGWAAGCMATGSVIRWEGHGGRWLMAHTVRWNGPEPCVRVLASDDLHDWRPVGDRPAFALADVLAECEPLGGGLRAFPHFRDPWLFARGGELWVGVCASRRGGPADGRGTLALGRWDEAAERFNPAGVLDVPAVAQEMECPQLHDLGDRWLLAFSSDAAWFTADYRRRIDPAGGLFAATADEPLGRFAEPRPLVPDGWQPTMYAAQLVEWHGAWVALATDLVGTGRVTDPMPVALPT